MAHCHLARFHIGRHGDHSSPAGEKLGVAFTILLIALVVILAFISNTVNIVAMLNNKERQGGDGTKMRV